MGIISVLASFEIIKTYFKIVPSSPFLKYCHVENRAQHIGMLRHVMEFILHITCKLGLY